MDPFKFAPVFANSDFNTRKEVTFDVGDIKWKTEGEHKGSRINKKDIKSIRFLKLTQACYQIRVKNNTFYTNNIAIIIIF